VSDSSFNANFYLAVAAAIPVLWITVGVATDVITRIIAGLRNSNVSVEIRVEMPFLSYSMSPAKIFMSAPFGTISLSGTYGPNSIAGAFFCALDSFRGGWRGTMRVRSILSEPKTQ
jgi:hypothetical protein